MFVSTMLLPAWLQAQTSTVAQAPQSSGAPIQLRDAGAAPAAVPATEQVSAQAAGKSLAAQQTPNRLIPPRLGEFERYVQSLPEGRDVRRLGAELAENAEDGLLAGTIPSSPIVPPDYLVQPGDELVLTIWGSVDADLRLVVDRVGRVNIPRVGTVLVSGVRQSDLADVIGRRVAQVFRNYQLSVSLGQLRGMRVFVTGFVERPGSLSLSSLSTLAQALLRAGGPAASGSFRDVQLRRGRSVVAKFDLYDLLLKGDRSADVVLQPDDVIHVGPVGPLVAIMGSVNRPAILELKPGETVGDAMRMAAGLSAVAETSRLSIERLSDRAGNRVVLLDLPAGMSAPLANGDVLRAFSAVDVVQSVVPRNKRVRVEGEVMRPGEYVLPPDSSTSDAIAAAGGLTQSAFLYGTVFERVSVRQLQAVNYDRALRDFETELVRTPVATRAANREEADTAAASAEAGARLLEKLRAIRPTGRIVLQIPPEATTLPQLAVEDGDRMYIPPRPNTVGVFGSVFSAGSYLHSPGRTVGDFLRLAGGPTRHADHGSVFVVRANGTVRSSLVNTSWLNRGNQLETLPTEPGDTVFVPDELSRITWVQAAKDWTQILYQFGLGIAGIKSAFN
ncbi:hypothetical protein AQPW35_25800 [Rubrivivax pictus]|uniref:Sugar ABC transporter substrate-binding protein n=2 Tax=Pseudaquabacterium pictum TaxID=2315236 RepID=A0A480APE4_9BURK|nr:hypothetical protein AQPW35_25800 [Rubrivivax pictus]